MPKASLLLRRTRLVLGVLTLSAVLGAAPAQAATPTAKVMSRNLYLGADLTPAIQATSFSQLLAADASIFTAVHATDFPSRAKVLAREIKDADPDLIGLQEAALWRQGPVGVLDGPATPSTEVVFDFLASLQSELGPCAWRCAPKPGRSTRTASGDGSRGASSWRGIGARSLGASGV